MFEPPQEISFQDAQEQYDKAVASSDLSRYRGRTYEDGVAAAIGWLLQERSEPPLPITYESEVDPSEEQTGAAGGRVDTETVDLLQGLQDSIEAAKRRREG